MLTVQLFMLCFVLRSLENMLGLDITLIAREINKHMQALLDDRNSLIMARPLNLGL